MVHLSSSVEKAVEVLKNGGIIAVPTEGVYGLSCDATNLEAVTRLRKLKERDDDKGFIIIAAEIDELEPFIEHLSPAHLRLVQSTWPGPVTWLVPAKHGLSSLIHGKNNSTIAVRVTSHPLLRQICQKIGHAIISTSANKAGAPPALQAKQIDDIFTINQIDYILEGALGELSGPTEIRDLESNTVIRPLI